MADPLDKFCDATAQAERLFVASVLLDAGRCAEIMATVNRADFNDATLGELFGLVAKLSEMGRPVSDPKFLTGQIAGTQLLKDLGGRVGFAELLNSVANCSHAVHYGDQVRAFAQRRRLRDAALALLNAVGDPDTDVAAAAADAMREIDQTISTTNERRDISAGDAAAAALDAMERSLRNESVDGITTGIRCIDEIAGAMHPGELVILAARPSIGKTTMAMDILRHAARSGRRGLFVSCEMDRRAIGDRLLATDTSINSERIARALVTDDQAQQLRDAAIALRDLNYRIIEASAPTVAQIGAWARAHAARYGLSLVVVDHVGLLRPTGKARNSYESATEIAKELKTLATSLKLPIMALCQLNRDGEGEIPKLSMLRDSGAIEENADKVWFIHRERGKSPTDFLIAKYRNGAVGSTESEDLVFDLDRCSFQDANSAVHQDFKAWSN